MFTRIGQTMIARLMEFQIWCPTARSVVGGLRKGTMASASTSVWEKAAPPGFALKPDNSVPPQMSLVHSNCCPSDGGQCE